MDESSFKSNTEEVVVMCIHEPPVGDSTRAAAPLGLAQKSDG